MATTITRLRILAPAHARRSHAERTAETRGRAMAAVVQTTAAEIARRAGVTWGAVPHHFGDKDGILKAVLEASFNRFAERLAGVPDGASLVVRELGRSGKRVGE